jgi:hypothetical protein
MSFLQRNPYTYTHEPLIMRKQEDSSGNREGMIEIKAKVSLQALS